MRSLRPAILHSSVAGRNNDLHAYDPASMTWYDLSSSTTGSTPSARYYHGFTSAGGKLYVHGGYADSGKAGACKAGPGGRGGVGWALLARGLRGLGCATGWERAVAGAAQLLRSAPRSSSYAPQAGLAEARGARGARGARRGFPRPLDPGRGARRGDLRAPRALAFPPTAEGGSEAPSSGGLAYGRGRCPSSPSAGIRGRGRVR